MEKDSPCGSCGDFREFVKRVDQEHIAAGAFRAEIRHMATSNQNAIAQQNVIGAAIAKQLERLNDSLVKAATTRIPVLVLVIIVVILGAVIVLQAQNITDRDLEASTTGFKSRRSTGTMRHDDRQKTDQLDREIPALQDGGAVQP